MYYCLLLTMFLMQACATSQSCSADARSQGSNTQLCQAYQQAWPEIIRTTESILRLRDRAAFKLACTDMHEKLDALDTAACPRFADAVALQHALIDEFSLIYGMTHDADQGEADTQKSFGNRSIDVLRAKYTALHDKACIEASQTSEHAWHVWQQQPHGLPLDDDMRTQRFVINIETDASLVGIDGTSESMAQDAAKFIALVTTPVLRNVEKHVLTLQGQGPTTPDQTERYVQASLAYAKQHHVSRVVFVNAAGGQIPDFSDAVRNSATLAMPASYVAFTGWADGTLVTPRVVAHYVASLMPQIMPDEASGLMVVNCNAGMDRSGTLNALVQLAVQAQQSKALHLSYAQLLEQGYAAIPDIVAKLKQARPHSISTFGRYMFIYQGFEAYVQSLSETEWVR